MKLPVRSVVWLLPLLLTGCFRRPLHKTQPTPASLLAPRLKPSHTIDTVTIQLPAADLLLAAYPMDNFRVPTQPIRQPFRHRRPAPDDAANPSDAALPAPAVNAIGQFSSGDAADSRQQTEDSIAAVERRLGGINRPLNDSEQRTADHIREFLRQARAALASGDLEGANTLAGKAQALLAGLTK